MDFATNQLLTCRHGDISWGDKMDMCYVCQLQSHSHRCQHTCTPVFDAGCDGKTPTQQSTDNNNNVISTHVRHINSTCPLIHPHYFSFINIIP